MSAKDRIREVLLGRGAGWAIRYAADEWTLHHGAPRTLQADNLTEALRKIAALPAAPR